MKKLTILLLLLGTSSVHADLQTLDNQALQAVEAQAGADLSLKLSLNHTSTYQFDDAVGGACDKTAMSNTGLGYCHLGISVNKRFVKETALGNGNWSVPESDPTSTNPARKLWLVFKGIQGTVNIQKLGLDGVDLVYKNDSGTEKIKPAIQLGFDATLPILIRNLGYNALAIEMDNFTSYIDPTTKQVIENTSTATAQDYGYLKATTYASNHTSVYDQNKEIGFMGLRMNGNLALQGNIKMFACDGSHPRC
ncbi:hypothetical protein ACJBLB_01930 [Acinetobacter junii]|uniref:hypothetical protein n=1 Tax=Acinetobacter junii TaxID=40215 RepID=UPI0038626627